MLAVTKVNSAIIEVAPNIAFFGLSGDWVMNFQKVQFGCIAIHVVRNPVVDSINVCSIIPLSWKYSSMGSSSFLARTLAIDTSFARSCLTVQPMIKKITADARGGVHGSFSTFVL